MHLGQAALVRGYTPGVVTAPLVVLPYSVWAWRRLRAAGVPAAGWSSAVSGLAMLPLALAGVHGAARLVTRAAGKRRAGRERAGRELVGRERERRVSGRWF